jgi:hypothetical protein
MLESEVRGARIVAFERHRAIQKFLAATLLAFCLCTPSAWTQSHSDTASRTDGGIGFAAPQNDGPEKGSHEWQVWVGTGEPVPIFGGVPDARVWTAGGRYGRVLTKAHGFGPLRGRFEWAADVLPIVEVSRPGRRVYGAGFDPVVWKWNFVARRGLSPYWEFSGGALFSNRQAIAGTTAFNFMPSMAVGIRFPWGKYGKYDWTTEVRFFHISDAGLTDYNPGINTVEFRVGLGFFSHQK